MTEFLKAGPDASIGDILFSQPERFGPLLLFANDVMRSNSELEPSMRELLQVPRLMGHSHVNSGEYSIRPVPVIRYRCPYSWQLENVCFPIFEMAKHLGQFRKAQLSHQLWTGFGRTLYQSDFWPSQSVRCRWYRPA